MGDNDISVAALDLLTAGVKAFVGKAVGTALASALDPVVTWAKSVAEQKRLAREIHAWAQMHHPPIGEADTDSGLTQATIILRAYGASVTDFVGMNFDPKRIADQVISSAHRKRDPLSDDVRAVCDEAIQRFYTRLIVAFPESWTLPIFQESLRRADQQLAQGVSILQKVDDLNSTMAIVKETVVAMSAQVDGDGRRDRASSRQIGGRVSTFAGIGSARRTLDLTPLRSLPSLLQTHGHEDRDTRIAMMKILRLGDAASVGALVALRIQQSLFEQPSTGFPADLPALWARIDTLGPARNLVDQLPDPADQVSALLDLIPAYSATSGADTTQLLRDARSIVNFVSDPETKSAALARLAFESALLGAVESASTYLDESGLLGPRQNEESSLSESRVESLINVAMCLRLLDRPDDLTSILASLPNRESRDDLVLVSYLAALDGDRSGSISAPFPLDAVDSESGHAIAALIRAVELTREGRPAAEVRVPIERAARLESAVSDDDLQALRSLRARIEARLDEDGVRTATLLARDLKDSAAAAELLTVIASEMETGHPEIRRTLGEALAFAVKIPGESARVVALCRIAGVYRAINCLTDADRVLKEADSALTSHGDPDPVPLSALAVACTTRGDVERARSYVERILNTSSKARAMIAMADALVADDRTDQSHIIDAKQLLLEVQTLSSIGTPDPQVADVLVIIAEAVARSDRPDDSMVLADLSLDIANAVRDDFARANTLSRIASVFAACGESAAAESVLTDARVAISKISPPHTTNVILVDVARVYLLLGLPGEAEAVAAGIDDRHDRVGILLEIAAQTAATHDGLAARTYLDDAEKLLFEAGTMVSDPLVERLAMGFAAIPDVAEAERIAGLLTHRPDDLLADIAVRLIQRHGDTGGGERLAKQILVNVGQFEEMSFAPTPVNLADVVTALVDSGDTAAAERIAASAQDRGDSGQLLRVLVEHLASKGNLSGGRKTLRMILDPASLSEAGEALVIRAADSCGLSEAIELVRDLPPSDGQQALQTLALWLVKRGRPTDVVELAESVVAQNLGVGSMLERSSRALAGVGALNTAERLASRIPSMERRVDVRTDIASRYADAGNDVRARALLDRSMAEIMSPGSESIAEGDAGADDPGAASHAVADLLADLEDREAAELANPAGWDFDALIRIARCYGRNRQRAEGLQVLGFAEQAVRARNQAPLIAEAFPEVAAAHIALDDGTTAVRLLADAHLAAVEIGRHVPAQGSRYLRGTVPHWIAVGRATEALQSLTEAERFIYMIDDHQVAAHAATQLLELAATTPNSTALTTRVCKWAEALGRRFPEEFSVRLLLDQAARSWSLVGDIVAAVRILGALPRYEAESATREVFSCLAVRDLDESLDLALTLPSSKLADIALSALSASIATDNPPNALDVASGIQQDRTFNDALAAIASVVARHVSAEAALDILGTQVRNTEPLLFGLPVPRTIAIDSVVCDVATRLVSVNHADVALAVTASHVRSSGRPAVLTSLVEQLIKKSDDGTRGLLPTTTNLLAHVSLGDRTMTGLEIARLFRDANLPSIAGGLARAQLLEADWVGWVDLLGKMANAGELSQSQLTWPQEFAAAAAESRRMGGDR